MPDELQNGLTQVDVSRLVQSLQTVQSILDRVNFNGKEGVSFVAPFVEIIIVQSRSSAGSTMHSVASSHAMEVSANYMVCAGKNGPHPIDPFDYREMVERSLRVYADIIR